MDKITSQHLERAAYVYVRQSTVEQVKHNRESQRLQYQLKHRAEQLGWKTVTVIDEDLGRSAGGTVKRTGFDHLLAEVCQGNAGAILALEASRLARNGREWHTLLELCAIVDTLLIDPQGIYSPKRSDDRLLLGMKGTLSEAELSVFRERSHAAIRQKAARGEYINNLPVGYIEEDNRIEKDPNERVQQALVQIFDAFQRLGSVRQMTMWFRQEGIDIPRVVQGTSNRQIVWREPGSETLLHILRNPIYAGAYAYGRRKKKVIVKDGRRLVKQSFRRDSREWDVLIQDHHEGYISWDVYQANQAMISENANMRGAMVKGPARGGHSLVVGLLRCGHCGRKMNVSYGGRDGRYVRYSCNKNTVNIDGERCINFSAWRVEQAVAQAVLQAISPLGIDATFEAETSHLQESDARLAQHQLQLEQARYESERCRRQYDSIEPENRLVARQLEARWNDALARVSELEAEGKALAQEKVPLTDKDRAELLSLGKDVARLWDDERSSNELKTRIVRTVLKEIVVYLEPREIRLMLHWHGDDHTQLQVRRLSFHQSRCQTESDVVDIICELARLMPDRQIAQVLNRLGKRTARDLSWNETRVASIRHHQDIAVYQEGERQARGEITLDEAAACLGVRSRVVKRAIENRILAAKQVCFGAPWCIRQEDVERLRIDPAWKNLQNRRPQPVDANQKAFTFYTHTKGAL